MFGFLLYPRVIENFSWFLGAISAYLALHALHGVSWFLGAVAACLACRSQLFLRERGVSWRYYPTFQTPHSACLACRSQLFFEREGSKLEELSGLSNLLTLDGFFNFQSKNVFHFTILPWLFGFSSLIFDSFWQVLWLFHRFRQFSSDFTSFLVFCIVLFCCWLTRETLLSFDFLVLASEFLHL